MVDYDTDPDDTYNNPVDDKVVGPNPEANNRGTIKTELEPEEELERASDSIL